ncbi:TPA: TniB family NTP-binding protein, partial [Escherichia coli]|nr:TniB family NTP-binding protein [Salmonella enterica]HCI0223972.1 TniB family NTP-binding protein [Salmonella enterica]HEA7480364.1 TniB family NTP-binding protein [Escherichia coli]
PADERIQRLRADRWIGYPRAVEALNRLEALYAWPNKQRMPNLLLVGPTNNGKSMIVEKFRRTHPASSDADQEHIPVLVVQMPSEPSVIRFYVALLAAMGAPLRPRPRLPEMEQLALALLRKVGVRMLVIVDNLSRNQDIAVGLQVILKPRARPTPTWTSMPERTLDFEF